MDYFGEAAILNKTNKKAAVKAKTNATLFVLLMENYLNNLFTQTLQKNSKNLWKVMN